MTDRYHNPFAGIDVHVPAEFHEDISRYAGRDGKTIIDDSPFPRMVDVWFLAICIAAREGMKPADVSKYETKKVIDGSIFGSDPWRIHVLMLVALSQTDDIDITLEPRKMMAIANGLAVAGLPHVLDMLKGDGEPIWNLSESIETMLLKKKAA